MARNFLLSMYDWGQDPNATVSGSFEAQLPGSNMLKPQPQLVAQSTGGGWTLDLGQQRNIGLVHFQRLVTDPGATITVSWGGYSTSGNAWATDQNGVYSGLELASIGRPRIFISPVPVAASSVSVSIGGGGSPLQCGYMGACEVWESPGGFSLGSALSYLDESDVQTVPFGSSYITLRAKRRRLDIGVGWLKDGRPYGSDDQADAVKTLMAINGFSSPVIGVRYPDDTFGLERDAVWGLLKKGDITNSFFATSAASFQIEGLS
jgi:hypothetical protein